MLLLFHGLPDWFPHFDKCWLILPFLDSFEVILTTLGFYNFRNYTPQISAWYCSYASFFLGFVPGVAKRAVRTSAGAIVYPDADNVMRTTSILHLPNTISEHKFYAANCHDLDSLLWTYKLVPMQAITGVGALLSFSLLDCLRQSIMWGCQSKCNSKAIYQAKYQPRFTSRPRM